jgi:LmbE family N-acetylglucosaminyl deacetylase
LEALAILGVDAANVTFMRLPDRYVPRHGTAGFIDAVDRFRKHVEALNQSRLTVIAPWRRDPHCDHRAAWEIVAASFPAPSDVRVIEYPIWVWEYGAPADFPLPDEVVPMRLEIGTELPGKCRAIAAHRSQTTGLIGDDPSGFRLTPEMLAGFTQPWEIYLEDRSPSLGYPQITDRSVT